MSNLKSNESFANMDIFRCLMMLFVVGHHYLGREIISKEISPLNLVSYELLRHIFIICVNGFILMSGYFISQAKFKVSKVFNLLLWLSIYSAGLYTIFSLLDYGTPLNKGMFIKSFFPLLFGGWWFMFPYFALFLLSPFLNILIHSLSQRHYIALLVVYFLIEVVWASFFQSSAIDKQAGYSLYNFIFLYLVGAHFRIYNYKLSKYKLWIAFLSITILASLFHYLLSHQLQQFNLFNISSRFFNYNFITVFIGAILFFVLFTKMKFHNKWVKSLRPHVLAVYLIHTHSSVEPFLYKYLFNSKHFIHNSFLVPRTIAFCLITFFICILIDYILRLIFNKPFHYISTYTNEFINKNLNQLFASLKIK